MNMSPTVSAMLEERYPVDICCGLLRDVTPHSVFELIRDIKDPEHPYTLEQLGVVSREYIYIETVECDGAAPDVGLPILRVCVVFRPTIPHCSMAAIIGLCIKTHLDRFIRSHAISVRIADGTHVNYKALNKQLNDKDRVMAALENETLIDLMKECLPDVSSVKHQ
ncbi:hypothetical protein HK407_05g09690 [Ordospora pajunii]|jgi:hypothetical protein|uniref:uncharacterized protein n=1 Tax=Ordospora pajunii TaxID=3039483 RepID=UPI0029525F6F|nr:uncharacterized protein HK407_05g09690 [Ordospora pajunii]KAH9411450.1 hypothetical protein HK407_05g09690 [Ordospora pajunii]